MQMGGVDETECISPATSSDSASVVADGVGAVEMAIDSPAPQILFEGNFISDDRAEQHAVDAFGSAFTDVHIGNIDCDDGDEDNASTATSMSGDSLQSGDQQDDPMNPVDTSSDEITEQCEQEISVAELIELMGNYQPLMPDALNDYFLEKAGLNCPDVRIKRVIALAAQKFITDVAKDALHFSKVRQQQTTQTRRSLKKEMLTMDDLSLALSEYGVNLKKPDYYQ